MSTAIEPVEEFRLRAREWPEEGQLAAKLGRMDGAEELACFQLHVAADVFHGGYGEQ